MSFPGQSIRIDENGVITDDTPLAALENYMESFARGLLQNVVLTAFSAKADLSNYLRQESPEIIFFRQVVQQGLHLLRGQAAEDSVNGAFSAGPAMQKQGLERVLIDEKFGDLDACAVCLEGFVHKVKKHQFYSNKSLFCFFASANSNELSSVRVQNRMKRLNQTAAQRRSNYILQMLITFKLEKLVITAIPDLVETWTKGFGFQPGEVEERKAPNKINLMLFPGTIFA
ncbi:hypothetical protein PTKIN_Ptkin04bG0062000 [Pterospermum kingtungense]